MDNVIVSHEQLKQLSYKKLKEVGLNEDHAKKVATILIHADLRNVNSHGVLRTEHYVNRIAAGGINTAPTISFEQTGKVTGVLNGGDGIGHVIADEATDKAIHLAKENGVGMVTAMNSSHCGALSYYVQKIAKHGLIGIAMSHTDKIVVPYGGTESFLGTNPIAYGVPAKRNKPFILDMATSNVALGKVLNHKEKNESIPHGWGVDERGESVTDPEKVVSLQPFGGVKGYGLAIVVDIFSGLLTGSKFGPHISKMYSDLDQKRKLGHYFCAIDPEMFTNKEQFLEQMDQMMEELRNVPPKKGVDQVYVPGDIEHADEERNKREGVTVPRSVFNYLNS